MSGCVNCVWDRYQDEVEDWVAKSSEARAKMEAQRASKEETSPPRTELPNHVASSMDDDGGGSEALWGEGEDNSLLALGGKAEDLMQGVPVGIREFMRTEKRLKERKSAIA